MTDDEGRRDFRHRDQVSMEDDEQVEDFAQRNSITPEQVRELIRKHGNNRAVLEIAAEAVRRVP